MWRATIVDRGPLGMVAAAWLCLFVGPPDGPAVAHAQSTTPAHAAADGDLTQQVRESIISRTNDFRQSHDLAPVQSDPQLQQAAREFAEFMARTGKYGHRADGSTPAQRAEAAGYAYCVVRENIAYRTNTGEVTADSLSDVFVQGWIDSPPHRENMLADFVTHTGVAVATSDGVTYFAVQMFGRPESKQFRLQVANQSGQPQTLMLQSDDQREKVQLQPRMIFTISRCFPTKVFLQGGDAAAAKRLTQDTQLTVTDSGIVTAGDD